MSIQPSDIKFKLSVPTASAGDTDAQSDPDASLGKYISTTEVGTSLHGLFDAVSGTENEALDVEYRCVFIHNTHADETWSSAKAYITGQSTGAAVLEVGVDPASASIADSASPQAETVADEGTVPDGVTFSAPGSRAESSVTIDHLAPNEVRALWLRRTAADTTEQSGVGATLRVVGDSGVSGAGARRFPGEDAAAGGSNNLATQLAYDLDPDDTETTYTVSLWVRKHSSSFDNLDGVGIFTNSNSVVSNDHFGIDLDGGGASVNYRFFGSGTALFGPADLGVWHHLAITRANTTAVNLYYDGTLIGSATLADNAHADLWEAIGLGRNQSGNKQAPVDLDAVGIWRGTVLDSDQIALLNNNGDGVTFAQLTDGLKTGLTEWYDLDEETDDATDEAGSSHTLTETGTVESVFGHVGDGDPISDPSDTGDSATLLTADHSGLTRIAGFRAGSGMDADDGASGLIQAVSGEAVISWDDAAGGNPFAQDGTADAPVLALAQTERANFQAPARLVRTDAPLSSRSQWTAQYRFTTSVNTDIPTVAAQRFAPNETWSRDDAAFSPVSTSFAIELTFTAEDTGSTDHQVILRLADSSELDQSNTDSIGFSLRFNPGNNKIAIWSSDGTNENRAGLSTDAVQGTKYHLLVVFNQATSQIDAFLDGGPRADWNELDFGVGLAHELADTIAATVFDIGDRRTGPNFQGWVDEVRFWIGAAVESFDQTTAQTLYNNGSGRLYEDLSGLGLTTDLLSAYKLNDGTDSHGSFDLTASDPAPTTIAREQILYEESDGSNAWLRHAINASGQFVVYHKGSGGTEQSVTMTTPITDAAGGDEAVVTVQRDGTSLAFFLDSVADGSGTIGSETGTGAETAILGGGADVGSELDGAMFAGRLLDMQMLDGVLSADEITRLSATMRINVSRVSGVAPLSVRVDLIQAAIALGLDASDLQHYTIVVDFGDGDASIFDMATFWTLSSGDLPHPLYNPNQPHGFSVAYTYETAGSRSIYLTILGRAPDDDDTVLWEGKIGDVSVSATPEGGWTTELHVASGGNDSNDGSQANPLATFAEAVTQAAAAGPRTRILLNRGDSHAIATEQVLDTWNGPVEIDAYGTGDKPILQWGEIEAAFGTTLVENRGSVDVRVKNVHFKSHEWFYRVFGLDIRQGVSGFLVQDCAFENLNRGINFNSSSAINVHFDRCEVHHCGPYSVGTDQGTNASLSATGCALHHTWDYGAGTSNLASGTIESYDVDGTAETLALVFESGTDLTEFSNAIGNATKGVFLPAGQFPANVESAAAYGLPVTDVTSLTVTCDLTGRVPPSGTGHGLTFTDTGSTPLSVSVDVMRIAGEHNWRGFRFQRLHIAALSIDGSDGANFKNGLTLRQEGTSTSHYAVVHNCHLRNADCGTQPNNAVSPSEGHQIVLWDGIAVEHTSPGATGSDHVTFRDGVSRDLRSQIDGQSAQGLAPATHIRFQRWLGFDGADSPNLTDVDLATYENDSKWVPLITGDTGEALDAGADPVVVRSSDTGIVVVTATGADQASQMPDGGTYSWRRRWQRRTDGGAWVDLGETGSVLYDRPGAGSHEYRVQVTDATAATAETSTTSPELVE